LRDHRQAEGPTGDDAKVGWLKSPICSRECVGIGAEAVKLPEHKDPLRRVFPAVSVQVFPT
jgi:hypothetical protein